ncbi:MAG: nucleoside hydrolase, partial [Anaerolineales bacterium]
LQAATGSDWFVLVELHLQLILPLLIPLALLFALLRRGLWGIAPAPFHLRVYAGLGLIVILGPLALGASIQSAVLGAVPDPSKPWVLPEGMQPRRIIVDTDLGNDDVLALLYLMQHPGVELQAITVVGTGLVHCAPGVRNVHGLLELAGYADIPVSCGSEEPLGQEAEPFPASWRTSADRLWGLGLPLNERQPASLAAPDLIADQLRQAEAPLTILALGPMTNLAQALAAYPEMLPKIEGLYSMGGAVEVPGNVYDPSLGFDNRTAEWNFFADPEAARQVFASGVPITLVPLDATNDVPVGMPLFRLLAQHHTTRAATFTYDIFYINQGWIQSGGYYLWDTLAASVLTNPEVAEYQDYELQVIDTPGPDYGRTLSGAGGLPVRVAIQADQAMFEEIFLRVINTDKKR